MDMKPKPAPSSQFSLSILGVLILRRATFGSMTRGGVDVGVLGFFLGGCLFLGLLLLRPCPCSTASASTHSR